MVLEDVLVFEDTVADVTCNATVCDIVKILEVTLSVQETRKLFAAHQALESAGFESHKAQIGRT
jgi:hypothetical protein